jgi:SAM-dependent methyltransferase
VSIFDKIYDGNVWGFGSGHGSLPSVTKGYRSFIENFLASHKIKSVLDYGCGDWQFSRFINWSGTHYTGVDVAKKVVEDNNQKFASDNVTFRAIEPSASEIPAADLLITKDVLQHLTRDEIASFTKNILPRYKYALITNCVLPVQEVNRDIRTGEFRPLDLRKPPFNLNAEEVFSFSGPKVFSWRQLKFFSSWKKIVLLVKNA